MINTENSLTIEECRRRTECLAEFMSEERFATLNRAVGQRTRYMTLLAENMFHPQNASALVRPTTRQAKTAWCSNWTTI